MPAPAISIYRNTLGHSSGVISLVYQIHMIPLH
jgi:hypothetical protein